MKCVVIGIGNTLFKDDGIGVYAALYLKTNYTFSPQLDIYDGGTLGLNLIDYLQAYDQVIILDTLSLDEQAGALFRIPAEEFIGLGDQRSTAHEVEVIQMLEAGMLHGVKANVMVLGIIPEDISTISIGLSRTMEVHFQKYLDLVLDEIAYLGIKATRTETLSLEDVVKALMGSYN